ncbi:MAG: MBL fold metallo-hydrolase [Gammaproteobacteria bacterium]
MKKNYLKILVITLGLNFTNLSANDRPEWFIPPPLNPEGVQLETVKLDDGVYALLSNTPFADNAGFIVGKDSVLVVDAHFNGKMASQIITAVREVTNLPIEYLVNLNAFGDHVFGNYAFPKSTKIISHEKTLNFLKENSLEKRKKIISVTVEGDMSIFDGVEDRLPEITFSDILRIDMGNKVVELHFFGPGMSSSDTVLYLPDSKIAWTGNLVFGKGSIPWARTEKISEYLETMKKFDSKISPNIIVSGHGKIADKSIIDKYISYLSNVISISEELTKKNININSHVQKISLNSDIYIEPNIEDLMEGFHKWNILNGFKQIQ